MDNALRFALASRLHGIATPLSTIAWDLAGELMAEESDPRALFLMAESESVGQRADEMQRAAFAV